MPSETSKGSCCCSRTIWIICLAVCGVVFLVSGLVFSVGGVFSNIINQQVDKVNTGKTGCNQKYVSTELFSVHYPHYPASRGPSIFLDKSERERDFMSRKFEGPLLAGYSHQIINIRVGKGVGGGYYMEVLWYYCWHVCYRGRGRGT